MVHGSVLVAPVAPATVTYEGVVINVNAASGYPTANAQLALAAGLGAEYTVIPPGSVATLNSPVTGAAQIAIIPTSVANTPVGLTCFFYYNGATVINTAPVINAAPLAAAC
jgi:MSHA pilin protein MshA